MKSKLFWLLSGLMMFMNCSLESSKFTDFNIRPRNMPEVFAPDVVSRGLNERDGCFAPDGSQFYYSIWAGGFGTIMNAQKIGDAWHDPEVVAFSGIYSDIEPFITHDGQTIFFASNRPVNEEDSTEDYDIWIVTRTERGWSEPKNVGAPVNSEENEFYPSVSIMGTLCFTGKRNQKDEDIFLAYADGDGYAEPERLPDTINSNGAEFNAYLALDESYLIHTAWGRPDAIGRGDLYISFKNKNGNWMQAMNMGGAVNTTTLDYCPNVSADGKVFIFTTSRSQSRTDLPETLCYQDLVDLHNAPQNGNSDIYWMSSEVIDSLKAECFMND